MRAAQVSKVEEDGYIKVQTTQVVEDLPPPVTMEHVTSPCLFVGEGLTTATLSLTFICTSF
jgi:hypothetical protein